MVADLRRNSTRDRRVHRALLEHDPAMKKSDHRLVVEIADGAAIEVPAERTILQALNDVDIRTLSTSRQGVRRQDDRRQGVRCCCRFALIVDQSRVKTGCVPSHYLGRVKGFRLVPLLTGQVVVVGGLPGALDRCKLVQHERGLAGRAVAGEERLGRPRLWQHRSVVGEVLEARRARRLMGVYAAIPRCH